MAEEKKYGEIKRLDDLELRATPDCGGFELWLLKNPENPNEPDKELCYFTDTGMIELKKWIDKQINKNRV